MFSLLFVIFVSFVVKLSFQICVSLAAFSRSVLRVLRGEVRFSVLCKFRKPRKFAGIVVQEHAAFGSAAPRRKRILMRKCGVLLSLLWTLWIRTQSPTSDTWNAAPGMPTEQRCADSMKEKLDLWRQFKDATFTGNSVTFTTNKTSMSYYCLPEQEDPRKGLPRGGNPKK